MPLADWQAALGTLVSTQAAEMPVPTSLDLLKLTPAERDWLAALPEAPGFQVTCAIQRWWRETRLRSVARLTLAALGPAQAATMLAAYLRTDVCTSLFFLPETLAFLRYVAEMTRDAQLAAIAQFERALLLAKDEAANNPVPLASSAMTLVEFAAPPEELLAALLQGQRLPEPRAERFPVVVSASLPHLWRPATTEEIAPHRHLN
jgi:hypothetical protein